MIIVFTDYEWYNFGVETDIFQVYTILLAGQDDQIFGC